MGGESWDGTLAAFQRTTTGVVARQLEARPGVTVLLTHTHTQVWCVWAIQAGSGLFWLFWLWSPGKAKRGGIRPMTNAPAEQQGPTHRHRSIFGDRRTAQHLVPSISESFQGSKRSGGMCITSKPSIRSTIGYRAWCRNRRFRGWTLELRKGLDS